MVHVLTAYGKLTTVLRCHMSNLTSAGNPRITTHHSIYPREKVYATLIPFVEHIFLQLTWFDVVGPPMGGREHGEVRRRGRRRHCRRRTCGDVGSHKVSAAADSRPEKVTNFSVLKAQATSQCSRPGRVSCVRHREGLHGRRSHPIGGMSRKGSVSFHDFFSPR